MRFLAVVAIVVMLMTPAAAGYPQVVLRNEPGGLIEKHVQRFNRMARNGTRVRIEGYCASACTIVLGAVPRERICVGPNAVLGFHSAFIRVDGEMVHSQSGTDWLWRLYPRDIRRWISRNGGLTPEMQYLRGKELRKYVRPCPR